MVELYDDGMLLALARFDLLLTVPPQVSLGVETPLKVNSLALIELVHDFVLTYFDMLDYLAPRPTEIVFLVGVENATRTAVGSLFLPPHGVESIGWQAPWSVDLPDVAAFSWAVKADLQSDSIAAIAFQLVQRLYAYLKRTTEEIPYLNEQRTEVDPSSFGRSS
jgi:hypothetical protein